MINWTYFDLLCLLSSHATIWAERIKCFLGFFTISSNLPVLSFLISKYIIFIRFIVILLATFQLADSANHFQSADSTNHLGHLDSKKRAKFLRRPGLRAGISSQYKVSLHKRSPLPTIRLSMGKLPPVGSARVGLASFSTFRP